MREFISQNISNKVKELKVTGQCVVDKRDGSFTLVLSCPDMPSTYDSNVYITGTVHYILMGAGDFHIIPVDGFLDRLHISRTIDLTLGMVAPDETVPRITDVEFYLSITNTDNKFKYVIDTLGTTFFDSDILKPGYVAFEFNDVMRTLFANYFDPQISWYGIMDNVWGGSASFGSQLEITTSDETTALGIESISDDGMYLYFNVKEFFKDLSYLESISFIDSMIGEEYYTDYEYSDPTGSDILQVGIIMWVEEDYKLHFRTVDKE